MTSFDGAPRAPNPAWVEMCERLAPPGLAVSWLKMVWEAGDPWQPIGRWTIWQMFPVGKVPTSKADGLRGPSPRSTGHACFDGYCQCLTKRRRWVDGPESAAGISLTTWKLFQETGCYGERYWVCQGTKGGHRSSYDAMESMTAQAMGLPEQPPEMGDLPYADPDRRTWDAIAQRDQVLQWEMETGLGALHPDRASKQIRDASERAAEKLARWLDAQYDEPTEGLVWALKRDTTIARPRAGLVVPVVDTDLVHHQLVQDLMPFNPKV